MKNLEQGGWIYFKNSMGKKLIIRACSIVRIEEYGDNNVLITNSLQVETGDCSITPDEYPGNIDLWVGAIKEAMSYPPHEYIEIDNYDNNNC